MTPSPPAPQKPDPSPGCGGDSCASPDCFPLHYVRHRSHFTRLCTSCVLRIHVTSFCSACFGILDSPSPAATLASCAKCPAVAHLSCVSPADRYLCPSCSSPTPFSYFNNPGSRSIDLSSAKVLLAAGQLAAASMTRAYAASKADAERKVKEAAVGRKRAREFLERALSISKKEKERVKEREVFEAAIGGATKKKPTKTEGTMQVKKTAQDRNLEKWMRFNEPIQAVLRLPVPPEKDVKDKALPPVVSVQNNVDADQKDQAGNFPLLPNSMIHERNETEMNKVQDFASVNEEERLAAEANKVPGMHEPTQDGSVPRTNNGAMFMGVPNTASLHS